MKLADKAVQGRVNKSLGRNVSEPVGSLLRIKLRWSSPLYGGEGSM